MSGIENFLRYWIYALDIKIKENKKSRLNIIRCKDAIDCIRFMLLL